MAYFQIFLHPGSAPAPLRWTFNSGRPPRLPRDPAKPLRLLSRAAGGIRAEEGVDDDAEVDVLIREGLQLTLDLSDVRPGRFAIGVR